MRAVEVLRQRLPPAHGGTQGYAQLEVEMADDDSEGQGYEYEPQYTPLYTNMKVLRRKQLDATLAYRRAGPCTKGCFVFSLAGLLFLSWLGFTLAAGDPYILVEENVATKLSLSRPVFGAAAMYLVCMCLSGYSWFRSDCGEQRLPTMGDSGQERGVL
ncbi:unnamed protein product [Discosporangium mesarthrocarpum]